MTSEAKPHVVVFSSLFPNPSQPTAGVFIRERMFRVSRILPITVVAPVPWFPFQGLIRLRRPHFRPQVPKTEVQDGIQILHPRFLSVPGLLKSLDGLFMALGSLRTLMRLKRAVGCNVIDAHFAYPDGYAATLLGKWLGLPVTITLRGTEVPLARTKLRRSLMIAALKRATALFSVSSSLKRLAEGTGIAESKIRVVGNGVDTGRFHPTPKELARRLLGLPLDAPVLISVGGLVERKGFHRVIECLPALLRHFPRLKYLIVGGPSAEGDLSERLKRMVKELGLEDTVRFLGPIAPRELKFKLSAADVFVLATSNEGWANVFLEAMACGLPVVTTDVGGNAEVVSRPELGALVPYGDIGALATALEEALRRQWDREAILAYAKANEWHTRVTTLVHEFRRLAAGESASEALIATNRGEHRGA